MSTELVQARLLAMRLSRHFSSDHASMVLKTSKSSSPLTASTCGAGSEIERGCRAEAASRSNVYDSKHQNRHQCLLTTCRNTKPHQALVRSTGCTSDKSERRKAALASEEAIESTCILARICTTDAARTAFANSFVYLLAAYGAIQSKSSSATL